MQSTSDKTICIKLWKLPKVILYFNQFPQNKVSRLLTSEKGCQTLEKYEKAK